MNISAILITKNEEKNIEDCLKSLDFCNEIIVVDDESTDRTVRIAKMMGAKVYIRCSSKNISAQYNFGASKAHQEWTLFINADERISKKLQEEIINKIQNSHFDAFYLKRTDFLLGKWIKHGEIGNFKAVRLVRKGKGEWFRRVHEYLKIKGSIGKISNPILHYPHPEISDFINSINRWSQWHTLANFEENKKSNIYKITFFPIIKFFKGYFFYFGFLDGIQGFIIAVFMSFHSFLSWSELWLKQKKLS